MYICICQIGTLVRLYIEIYDFLRLKTLCCIELASEIVTKAILNEADPIIRFEVN